MGTGAHKVLRRQDITFEDKDQALRDDVRTLGTMVGDLIREQGGEELSTPVLSCPLDHAVRDAALSCFSLDAPPEALLHGPLLDALAA